MRIHQVAALEGLADVVVDLGVGGIVGGEDRLQLGQLVFAQLVAVLGVQLFHQFAGALGAEQVVEHALDIGRLEDVHRRRGGGDHAAVVQIVAAVVHPIGQHIVAVRGDQDFFHRQAHLHGVVTAEGVAEVAAGHVQVDLVAELNRALAHQLKIAVDVVDLLEDDAPEVHRVGG